VKAGIFGGTFDPPHTGHLVVAQDAALALGLDRIVFIPAAQPPHKRHLKISAADLRARMLELAVSGNDRFQVDLRELDRTGPSYTVDTLRQLAAEQPRTEWTLLVGIDQYDEFHTWHEPDAIRALARLAVLTRSGSTAGDAREPVAAAPELGGVRVRELGDGAVQVAVTRVDISSTEVRARVAEGLPIRYLVPDAVAELIFERRLYRRNGPEVTG
jgi:nicotinate-nucleotide adenylyltransferase